MSEKSSIKESKYIYLLHTLIYQKKKKEKDSNKSKENNNKLSRWKFEMSV